MGKAVAAEATQHLYRLLINKETFESIFSTQHFHSHTYFAWLSNISAYSTVHSSRNWTAVTNLLALLLNSEREQYFKWFPTIIIITRCWWAVFVAGKPQDCGWRKK